MVVERGCYTTVLSVISRKSRWNQSSYCSRMATLLRSTVAVVKHPLSTSFRTQREGVGSRFPCMWGQYKHLNPYLVYPQCILIVKRETDEEVHLAHHLAEDARDFIA